MKIKKSTGEILKWSKAFGNWSQIFKAQRRLANHQHLQWFMVQLPVHLKTNQMMFRAVEALRLHPWSNVLHQKKWRNDLN